MKILEKPRYTVIDDIRPFDERDNVTTSELKFHSSQGVEVYWLLQYPYQRSSQFRFKVV